MSAVAPERRQGAPAPVDTAALTGKAVWVISGVGDVRRGLMGAPLSGARGHVPPSPGLKRVPSTDVGVDHATRPSGV